MTITALNIITSAMRKIGAITKNETPSSDEANDGLEMLNDMLGSWSTDSIQIPARTLESFALTGAASYTIGSGGVFATTRPIKIVSAFLRSGTTDTSLTPINDEDYAAIPDKSTQGEADKIHYNNAYPLGTIKMHPVPSSAYTLWLLSEKPLTEFAALTTPVDLPPGSKRALIYNLGVEMGPEYGQPIDPMVQKIANDSKGALATAVIRNRSMDVPKAQGGGTIYTGYR